MVIDSGLIGRLKQDKKMSKCHLPRVIFHEVYIVYVVYLKMVKSHVWIPDKNGGKFINSQTRPIHAREEDETRRQGSYSP